MNMNNWNCIAELEETAIRRIRCGDKVLCVHRNKYLGIAETVSQAKALFEEAKSEILYDFVFMKIVKQVLGENAFEKHSIEELSKMFEVYQFTEVDNLNLPKQVLYNRNLLGTIVTKWNEDFSVTVCFNPSEGAFSHLFKHE